MYQLGERADEKKLIKTIIKICLILAIVNLPFITIIQQLGMGVFIDTFDHTENYQYLKSKSLHAECQGTSYFIIQKVTHPDFSIIAGDEIFYLDDEAKLGFRKVYNIVNKNPFLNANYKITTSNSPAVDTGTNYNYITSNYDNKAPDIGWYEYIFPVPETNGDTNGITNNIYKNLQNVIIGPNPYIPNDGNYATGTKDTGIIFNKN